MTRAAPGSRQVAAGNSPALQSSGSGAWIANALRRSPVNQTCIISLPCRRFAPGGHEPSACGVRPRFSRLTQTRCECQRVSGPPGVGPGMPRRSARRRR